MSHDPDEKQHAVRQTVMSVLPAPKGLRLHIGLFGLRNAGKSSLINALSGQNISIVSSEPGTTTDPVEKAYELSPVGPVVFVDTAGTDDTGELGLERVRRSLKVMEWVDLAIVAIPAGDALRDEEKRLLERMKARALPAVVALTHSDLARSSEALRKTLSGYGFPVVETAARDAASIGRLREALVRLAREHTEPDKALTEGLVGPGDTVLLVTPIDIGAPKGRLILPQVQTLRELLDAHARVLVVQVDQVRAMLEDLRHPPALIITDSQVVLEVARQTPDSIALTTFSILMGASKSDIIALAQGCAALSRLQDGDRVLILETCSHHPQKDDIGRVKIPRWLREKTGKDLRIDIAVGKDIPDDFTPYKVLIQCGGCVVTRRHMLSRLAQANAQHIPMTNYGMTISFLQGLIERVLKAHPEALAAYRAACGGQQF